MRVARGSTLCTLETGLHRPAVDHVALEFRTEMCSHGRRPALLLHWLVCGGLGRGTRARRRILGCHCCKRVLGNWNVAAQTCLRKAPEFVGSRAEGFPKGNFTQGFVRIETPQRQLVPRCSSAPRVLGTLSLLLVPRPPYSAGFLRRHNYVLAAREQRSPWRQSSWAADQNGVTKTGAVF